MKKYKLLFAIVFSMFLMIPIHVYAFHLNVEIIGNGDTVIEAESSDTISAIKGKVEDVLGIPAEKQIISFNGNKLEDGRSLENYGVTEDKKIQVSLKDELTTIKIVVDNPIEGAKPDYTADVVVSNDDNSKKIEMKDVKIGWYKLSDDLSDKTLLSEDDVFEKGQRYYPNFTSESDDLVEAELEKNNYMISDDVNHFLNGNLVTMYNYFYIGGVKSINHEIEKLIIGKEFPEKVKVVFVTEDEEKVLEFDAIEWIEIDENGNKLDLASGLVEANKRYIPGIDVTNNTVFDKYFSMMDVRTKHTFNGKDIPYFVGTDEIYEVVFDANGGIFKNDIKTMNIEDIINFNYDAFEKPTKNGYKFIGFYTKDGKSYLEVMNSETGIEEDTTFYAKWEENSEVTPSIPDEENPKTFDNIGTSIFMGTISLSGLVGATIYLRKKNKVRAN